jgi:hypothetical protein
MAICLDWHAGTNTRAPLIMSSGCRLHAVVAVAIVNALFFGGCDVLHRACEGPSLGLSIDGRQTQVQQSQPPEIAMLTSRSFTPKSIRSPLLLLALAVGVLGSAVPGHATDNGVGDGVCPAWTTFKCTKWSLGPPAQCTANVCVADKASDPITKASALSGRTMSKRLRKQ